ncbi:hypothetical protein KIPB_007364 [Kipferlia bialata]|uniref:Uncharacterized protein n=1 Tax=Kipferlia bialata TaxID=797122 RepID=A0A9K3D103_9EUKA|nr:hypothetical protein KIPB_007364 [Kipferlia bialata]|eukprot:g7364.t1
MRIGFQLMTGEQVLETEITRDIVSRTLGSFVPDIQGIVLSRLEGSDSEDDSESDSHDESESESESEADCIPESVASFYSVTDETEYPASLPIGFLTSLPMDKMDRVLWIRVQFGATTEPPTLPLDGFPGPVPRVISTTQCKGMDLDPLSAVFYPSGVVNVLSLSHDHLVTSVGGVVRQCLKIRNTPSNHIVCPSHKGIHLLVIKDAPTLYALGQDGVHATWVEVDMDVSTDATAALKQGHSLTIPVRDSSPLDTSPRCVVGVVAETCLTHVLCLSFSEDGCPLLDVRATPQDLPVVEVQDPFYKDGYHPEGHFNKRGLYTDGSLASFNYEGYHSNGDYGIDRDGYYRDGL